MLADAGATFSRMDMASSTRPRPRFGSYAPIFTETGVAAEIMNLLSSVSLGRLSAPRISGVYKDLVWKQNMSTSSLISCPMVSGKTPVLSITKSGLGLGDKTRPLLGKGKAAEHAGNFMYNRERQVEHL